MEIEKIQAILAEFATERDWDQFHNPKNLAMAMSVEASEILEHFQWLTPEQAEVMKADPEIKPLVSEEIADVMIYLLRIADTLEVDIEEAVFAKIEKNAEKYPVSLSKGQATKYSRRDN